MLTYGRRAWTGRRHEPIYIGGIHMSIVDKVKEMLGQHSDKAEKGVDKAGDVIDEKTGGKYSDKIDTAQDKAKDYLHREGQQQEGKNDQPGA
jgi:hypothetical protein